MSWLFGPVSRHHPHPIESGIEITASGSPRSPSLSPPAAIDVASAAGDRGRQGRTGRRGLRQQRRSAGQQGQRRARPPSGPPRPQRLRFPYRRARPVRPGGASQVRNLPREGAWPGKGRGLQSGRRGPPRSGPAPPWGDHPSHTQAGALWGGQALGSVLLVHRLNGIRKPPWQGWSRH